MEYEVTLMTTRGRPATAPVIAYFEELPDRGDYELLCMRNGEREATLFISDDAVYRDGL